MYERELRLPGHLKLTRFDGHLTSPKLRAEVFNEQQEQKAGVVKFEA